MYKRQVKEAVRRKMVNPGAETLFAIHQEIHSPDAVRTVLSPNPIEPAADMSEFSDDFEEDMPEPEVPTGRSLKHSHSSSSSNALLHDREPENRSSKIIFFSTLLFLVGILHSSQVTRRSDR